jgi:hypothetical protein
MFLLSAELDDANIVRGEDHSMAPKVVDEWRDVALEVGSV